MLKNQKKIIVAGAIGNTLEWYDFTIYAFFVPIIAQQFFPNHDPFVSILATFGVFAIGFLVRPLGAILFGYIGDHTGRKKALVLSMIMMSFPTFLIGLLPDYFSIGLWAPLLLIGLRVIQGLAVSGELTTATVFLIEHAEKHHRGLAGSLAMAGALFGMVLSAIFATIMTESMDQGTVAIWGWRIPFLLGGLIGVLGLVIRLRTIEPPEYEQMHAEKKKSPQPVSVKNHISSLPLRSLATGIFFTSIMAVANYFLIAFFNTFLVHNQGLALPAVMLINTIAIMIQVLMTIAMGHLSDTLGRKTVLRTGIICLISLIYPIFWLLTQHDLILALLGEGLFALAAGTLTGVVPTLLSELFDTHHRNMGISITYNISLALFGGTAPLVAITLVNYTNNPCSPAWYVIGCGCIALFALTTSRRRAALSKATCT